MFLDPDDNFRSKRQRAHGHAYKLSGTGELSGYLPRRGLRSDRRTRVVPAFFWRYMVRPQCESEPSSYFYPAIVPRSRILLSNRCAITPPQCLSQAAKIVDLVSLVKGSSRSFCERQPSTRLPVMIPSARESPAVTGFRDKAQQRPCLGGELRCNWPQSQSPRPPRSHRRPSDDASQRPR